MLIEEGRGFFRRVVIRAGNVCVPFDFDSIATRDLPSSYVESDSRLEEQYAVENLYACAKLHVHAGVDSTATQPRGIRFEFREQNLDSRRKNFGSIDVQPTTEGVCVISFKRRSINQVGTVRGAFQPDAPTIAFQSAKCYC